MDRAQPDIDALIDEGLTRYGRGDLGGALTAWERVLELDPHHEQALGYIDYVRMNYELLVGEASGHGEPAPFAIAGDDPEYQIPAATDELAEGSAAPQDGGGLDGWAIEEEQPVYGRLTVEALTFELADKEPELELGPPRTAEATESTGVSFEDATSEYSSEHRQAPAATPAPAPAPAPADDGTSQEFRLESTPTPGFGPEPTPGFGSPGDVQTPQGFAAQLTDVRPRELGFVQPVPPPVVAPPVLPARLPPEPPQRDSPSYDPDPPTLERAPTDTSRADLISSLPARRVPRPIGGPTRDLPSATRKPALPDLPGLPASPRDLSARATAPTGTRSPFEGLRTPTPPDLSGALDFDVPTERKDHRSVPPPAARPGVPGMGAPNPVVAIPTRDLGLRPKSNTRPDTEDEPTSPTEVVPSTRAPSKPAEPIVTRADLVLPFDPIDARSVQILDAIDRHVPAPPGESRDDCTRRRITALFEHAIEWNKASELDRAVAAIDLALSEDPNSALAQKLIQRNRETIMNVFQAFLGDLNRTPILARPLHELADAPISPRAAFLLSRVDGLLSIDEILDVSGMPRIEAYRYLCQLFLRGILR
ncbi:MAG TPA: hypothetical protein VK932_06950 [Kofleriaceae bacterium]|nr:hypothetical protein [Kofleriaceae bacterium]